VADDSPEDDATAAFTVVVEGLFEMHADRLRRYVFRFVRSWETAEDLVQDLFLRLLDRRQTLASVSDVEGYLYIAARNRALDHVKQQQRRVEEGVGPRKRYESPVITAHAPLVPRDPAQELLSAEIAAAVQRAVDALPPRQREVILLQWSGHSYDEIATALNISPKTVSNHLTRAIESLRGALSDLHG